MNKGTDQNSRILAALYPDSISMDERSILDMVKFTLDFAEQLNFYGPDNRKDGNWSEVFLSDPIFIIAMIATWDIKKYREFHDKLLDDASAKLTEEEILEILDNMLNMIGQASDWSERLENSGYRGSLNKELKQIISSLDSELKIIGACINNVRKVTDTALWNKINLKYENEIEKFGEFNWDEVNIGEDIQPHPDSDFLSSLMAHLYRDFVFIKDKATGRFEEELRGGHNHPPHTGLLLTFFKLFKHLQNDINLLTYKHLKYYYEKLLLIEPRKDNLLSAIAALQLQPGKDSLNIGRSDKFDFVLDNKTELTFKPKEEIQINRAVLTDIKTLYKSLYLPLRNDDLVPDISLSRIYQSSILEDGTSYWNKEARDFDKLPKALGEEIRPGLNDDRHQESEIGLMICSPALILEAGKQTIDVRFKLSDDSFRSTEIMIGRLPQRLPDEESDNEETLDVKTAMARILNNIFLVYITARDGWKKIEQVSTALNQEEATLSFKLELKPIEEELVPIDPEVHDCAYSSEWPCIKILLNNDISHHPYNLISGVVIDDVSIESRVEEVTNLTLSNSLGNLDPSIPFAPFGPGPTIGSFLRIENPLIFQRNLSSLEIRLDWTALPQIRNGFQAYYEGYPESVNNESFKATLSPSRNLVRNSNQKDLQTFSLFGSIGSAERIDGDKTVKVNLDGLRFKNPVQSPEQLSESNHTPLYLLLTAPNMAFGHQIYPNLYSETVIKGSGLFRKKLKVPEQPYTPMLESLSISYTNFTKETILRKQDEKSISVKLIHLYPFGHVQVFPGLIKGPCPLLPQIEHRGNLMLGLEEVVPGQEVSIGFELLPAAWSHTVVSKPKIKWEYLFEDYWLPFYYFVLEDSTDGLLRSGIVKVLIPEVISTNHTRMPTGKFWIRAVSDSRQDLDTRLKGVFTQAVSLHATDDSLKQLPDKQGPLNVERISYQAKPGIQSITGPVNLSWESAEETEIGQFTRVSERLRHKNRAVSNWDFEHLVLQQFPQIERIRVYGRNSRPREIVKNATIQVVVVPRSEPHETIHKRMKQVPCHTLFEIRDFLKPYMGAFARIEVANPVYEELKVKCKVRFIDARRGGYYRDKLNEELIRCLSPGNPESLIPVGFDPSVSKTEILNFIENRDYVNFVTEFSVLQIIEVQGNYKIIDTADRTKIGLMRTISGYALLTSAPKHLIELIDDDEFQKPDKSTIGDLFIDSDFIISDKEGKYH